MSPRRSFQPTTPMRGRPSAAPEEQLPSSWEAVCEWVLTKRTSLWDVLLESAFLQVPSLLNDVLAQQSYPTRFPPSLRDAES